MYEYKKYCILTYITDMPTNAPAWPHSEIPTKHTEDSVVESPCIEMTEDNEHIGLEVDNSKSQIEMYSG